MTNPKYFNRLDQVDGLSINDRANLEEVCNKFAFRANEYYLSLINWDDPDDPIRKIIIPDNAELDNWGALDPSNEEKYTVVPGLEHKYEHIAVLLVSNNCGGYCRFCFRKRIFMNGNNEIKHDISKALTYIRKHKELNNILLTGGDSLLLSTEKLGKIISQLREIDHVKIIRLGTKIPSFNPYRILEDPTLIEMLEKYSTPDKKIYLMAHFNHPRELTEQAIKAMHMVQKAGVVVVNQTPLIRGVNDTPEVLAELFNKLSFAGIPPYYAFQCRPTQGNSHLAIPVEEAYRLFEKAKMMVSGLAKRARLSMSHIEGKIEIVGLTKDNIIFKFHRSADPSLKANIQIFKRNPDAYWYDDYSEMIDEYVLENPFFTEQDMGIRQDCIPTAF
ncbi:KamA family radical SAM protein [Candidatus Latescibacterota bacterium]